MMEHDMREKARHAMRLILEAARFEVEEVDDPLDLSAVRDNTCLLVLCSNDSDLISQFDKTNYSLMVDDHEMTCSKLLFSIDKDIVTENCIHWGVDEFVRYTVRRCLPIFLTVNWHWISHRPKEENNGCCYHGQEESPERRIVRYHNTPLPDKNYRTGSDPDGGSSGELPNSVSYPIIFFIIRAVANRSTRIGAFLLMLTDGVQLMQSME